jgi:hypothetical protein
MIQAIECKNFCVRRQNYKIFIIEMLKVINFTKIRKIHFSDNFIIYILFYNFLWLWDNLLKIYTFYCYSYGESKIIFFIFISELKKSYWWNKHKRRCYIFIYFPFIFWKLIFRPIEKRKNLDSFFKY